MGKRPQHSKIRGMKNSWAANRDGFIPFVDWFGAEISSGTTGTYTRLQSSISPDRDCRVVIFSGQFCADAHLALVQVELYLTACLVTHLHHFWLASYPLRVVFDSQIRL